MRYFKDDKEQMRAIDNNQEFLIQDSWLELEADENGLPYKAYMPDGTPDTPEIGRLVIEANIAKQVGEAKQYLNSTDHKVYPHYLAKDGEDVEAIITKRHETVTFIRENEDA